MNLNKHLEFLTPAAYNKTIHIIGVGAVGSRIAEQLARLGFHKFEIYDFDTVDDINIPNQLFLPAQIGMDKVDALEEQMLAINSTINIKKHPKGYVRQTLFGAVFLAVDSIELRHSIVKENMYNDNIDVMFDGRMRLTDAQYYGANWNKPGHRKYLLSTMQFSDASADNATPVSVCGSSLSVVPTVVTLSSVIVANFINYVKKEEVKQMALIDPFAGFMDAEVFE